MRTFRIVAISAVTGILAGYILCLAHIAAQKNHRINCEVCSFAEK